MNSKDKLDILHHVLRLHFPILAVRSSISHQMATFSSLNAFALRRDRLPEHMVKAGAIF